MSVVVVKKLPDRIEIGSDNQTTAGRYKILRNQACKLVQLEPDFLIGHSGWSRNFYFMQRFMTVSKPAGEDEDSFSDLYQGFLEYAASQVHNGDISTAGDSDFLVVYGSSVFLLGDYRAKEVEDYEVIGSGSAYARGVLHSLAELGQEDLGIEPALKAACHMDLYCHEPIIMYTVPLEESLE